MDKKIYRNLIFHLFKSGKKPKEIFEELESIHGTDAPSISTVRYWVRSFKFCGDSTSDALRSGRPISAISQQLIDRVAERLKEKPKLGVRSLAGELGESVGTVFRVIHDYLGYKKLYATWVPHKLNAEQQAKRVSDCRRFLRHFSANFDEKKFALITSDETWVMYETPDTNESAREWRPSGSAPPVRERLSPRGDKVMLTVWWDAKGVILLDFWHKNDQIPMNRIYYIEQLQKLRLEIPKKRRGLIKKGPQILIDNAPIHTAQETRKCIQDLGFSLIEWPPYSPDIAPSDFYHFRNLKSWLRGQKFSTREELERDVSAYFESKPTSYYERGIYQLPQRMREVIKLGGEYLRE